MLKSENNKLLLHACCAPCSVAIIEELKQSGRELTVFFYNPNLFPEEEYFKRKADVVKVCQKWGIPMIDWDYDHEKWETEVAHISQEQEGGSRCSACIRQRLMTAAECAKAKEFSQFTTSLSSGRQKRSVIINAIGQAVAELTGVSFLAEDWKKAGRQERGLELVKEMDIYRQKYCGCRYSLADRS